MRDLPENIAPNNILQNLHFKMKEVLDESSLIAHNRAKHLEKLKGNGGYFQAYEATNEPFVDAHKRSKALKSDLPEGKEIFVPAKIKKLMKFEYPFGDDKDGKYVQNFLTQEDPYEATRDERLRAKWIEEAKMLYGDFRPTGPQKPIQEITRSKMEEIVESLKRLLLSDWNDVNFVIGTNPNDQIEIKFDRNTIDTLAGLHAYMNTMLNTNDEVIRYQLRKLPRYWGYREDNYIYYMLTPPWVKMFVNDVINQVRSSNKRTALMMQG